MTTKHEICKLPNQSRFNVTIETETSEHHNISIDLRGVQGGFELFKDHEISPHKLVWCGLSLASSTLGQTCVLLLSTVFVPHKYRVPRVSFEIIFRAQRGAIMEITDMKFSERRSYHRKCGKEKTATNTVEFTKRQFLGWFQEPEKEISTPQAKPCGHRDEVKLTHDWLSLLPNQSIRQRRRNRCLINL